MNESQKRIRISIVAGVGMAVAVLIIAFALGRWSGGGRRSELEAFIATRTNVLTAIKQGFESRPKGVEFSGEKTPDLGNIFHPGNTHIRKVALRSGWRTRGVITVPLRVTGKFLPNDGVNSSKTAISAQLLKTFFAVLDRQGLRVNDSPLSDGNATFNVTYRWWETADERIHVMGMVSYDEATSSALVRCIIIEHF